MMQQANIKVAVRVRPLLEDELQKGHTCSKLKIDAESKSINVFNDRTNVYKNSQFDFVLDQTATQRKVYDKSQINDMVKASVDGYHATIFAYGQTGSGKTYTMEGYRYKPNDKGLPVPIFESNSESEGIVPRSVHHLFEYIKQQMNLQQKKYTVYCSYLQVYKEKIFDLLNKAQVKTLQQEGPGLKLKWTKNDYFTVENLYTFECKSPEDVLALYQFGIKNKVVASHNMNNSSSRSHSMLSLTIEQVDSKNPDNIIQSKLQLVDLAGSERQSFTGKAADKESIDINKSLFTLRQVITALTEKKSAHAPQQYIPYRESKLTSLLRQSLGGNSYCLMIACLNPCDAYVEENINTLQYASKASYISNKPVKNDDPKMRLIEQLKSENRMLNEELLKANETIQFLSQITGSDPNVIKKNLGNVSSPTKQSTKVDDLKPHTRAVSASSAVTEKRGGDITSQLIKDKDNIEKFFKEKSETLQNIANPKSQLQQQPQFPSAVNESKDAITERIIHTVNMMKEVLQSNLSLRETIQKQSETIDSLNSEIFQLSNENEDLRERLQVLEDLTGQETGNGVAKLVKEKKMLMNRVKVLEKTSNNWQINQIKRQQSQVHNYQMQNSNDQEQITATGDDDYEPQKCADFSDTNSADQPSIPSRQMQSQHNSVQRASFQQPLSQHQFYNPQQQTDSHQDFKIRTVKTLSQAYSQVNSQSSQQQASRSNGGNRNYISNSNKSSTQMSSATKFTQPINMTEQRHRNSLIQKNPPQLMNHYSDNQNQHHNPQLENTRNSNQASKNSFVRVASGRQKQQPKMASKNSAQQMMFIREKFFENNTQSNVTMMFSDPSMGGERQRPPKSPNKYSSQSKNKPPMAQATPNGGVLLLKQNHKLNITVDNIVQQNQSFNIDVDDDEPTRAIIDNDDDDQYFDLDHKGAADEAVNMQKLRSESGLGGHLDVSLPLINKQVFQ